MPNLLKSGPYRFYIWSNEPDRPHVHVDRDDLTVKFWLAPVTLARNNGFGASELRKIQRLVQENEVLLLEKWRERIKPR